MIGWTRNDRGNVAVYFAMACLALAGLGAGALTMARLNGAGSRLQDTADGAALAAAVQAQDQRATEADIKLAAARFAQTALRAGPHETSPAAISVEVVRRAPAEVTVSFNQEVRTILAGFVGRDRIEVRRRATAVSGPERKTCLHVLEPSAASALALQGNPKLTAPDCVVQVDSTAEGALHVQGAASGEAQAAYVAGPATPVRRWTPAPLFDQGARPDPLLERVRWPAAGPCIAQPQNAGVLSPGAYCEGLRLGGGVRLEPGVYLILSGGVAVDGRGVLARGVALVLLDPAGEFDVKGPASITLSAPTSGPWAGIALAARPGAAMPTSKIGGSVELGGTMYLPGHRLLLQGNARVGGAAADRAVIVRQLLARGTPDLQLAGGHPSGRYDAVRLAR